MRSSQVPVASAGRVITSSFFTLTTGAALAAATTAKTSPASSMPSANFNPPAFFRSAKYCERKPGRHSQLAARFSHQFADVNAVKREPRHTIPHEQSVTAGHATVQTSTDRWLRQDVLGPHAETLPWGGSQQSQESGMFGITNTVEVECSCRIGGSAGHR